MIPAGSDITAPPLPYLILAQRGLVRRARTLPFTQLCCGHLCLSLMCNSAEVWQGVLGQRPRVRTTEAVGAGVVSFGAVSMGKLLGGSVCVA